MAQARALFRATTMARHLFASPSAALRCTVAVPVRCMATASPAATAAASGSAAGKKITDYTRFFSKLTLRRQPRIEDAFFTDPYFPFAALSFALKSGEKLELTQKELSEALQYSATPGLTGLTDWLKALQQRTHSPPYAGGAGDKSSEYAVTVTVGTQDVIREALRSLINPGDSVLVESPTYSGTLSFLFPLDCPLIGVETDGSGIVPESLEKAIKIANPKPKIMSSIPTGQYSSCTTYTDERRRALYALACTHDLLILEDAPSVRLFGEKAAPSDPSVTRPAPSSLLSMDVEGRVLRFDSLFKSEGQTRLGFLTGPTPLIERIKLHNQVTNVYSWVKSQALALKLLQKWGPNGWDKHIDEVSPVCVYLRFDPWK